MNLALNFGMLVSRVMSASTSQPKCMCNFYKQRIFSLELSELIQTFTIHSCIKLVEKE